MTNVDAGVRERERVAALHRYDVLDTPAEEAFDRITRLAKNLLHMAIVTVSFIDSHRQWFKSRQGLASTEALRDTAFFGEVIKQDEAFIVEDALNDFLDGKPIRQPRTVARGCIIQFEGGEGPDAARVSYAREVAPTSDRAELGAEAAVSVPDFSE